MSTKNPTMAMRSPVPPKPDRGPQAIPESEQWLRPLLEMARTDDSGQDRWALDNSILRGLEACYDYCTRITAYHSKSFHMASGLLPTDKRQAVRALYAFCRTTDDIVDMSSSHDSTQISRWRYDTAGDSIRFNDPVAIAWSDTRKKFRIPGKYADQLIDGVEMDLSKDRYANFDELALYCYGVASSVGLMSMHIVGFESEQALPYAIKLGVALQMTNILRDINEDWDRGRIYLPMDELEEFRISPGHFEHKINDGRWKAMMQFQIDRTRQLYAEAWPGIQMLHKDGRLAIAAAASFYRDILTKIEENDYDVFSTRASVSKWGKLKLVPDLLFKYKYASSLNSLLS